MPAMGHYDYKWIPYSGGTTTATDYTPGYWTTTTTGGSLSDYQTANAQTGTTKKGV